MYTGTHGHIHIYIHTYTYTHTYNIYPHLHAHTYRHICIHRHINKCKAIYNLFQESPHPDLASRGNESAENQTTGFHKMRDTRAGNSRTESSNKSQ